MSNKKWVQEDHYHFLKFTPFYDEEVVAVLYQDEDGDWLYRSEVAGVDSECVGDSDECLYYIKQRVEEEIIGYYEGQRDYYLELVNKFIED